MPRLDEVLPEFVQLGVCAPLFLEGRLSDVQSGDWAGAFDTKMPAQTLLEHIESQPLSVPTVETALSALAQSRQHGRGWMSGLTAQADDFLQTRGGRFSAPFLALTGDQR